MGWSGKGEAVLSPSPASRRSRRHGRIIVIHVITSRTKSRSSFVHQSRKLPRSALQVFCRGQYMDVYKLKLLRKFYHLQQRREDCSRAVIESSMTKSFVGRLPRGASAGPL